ncbi:MAG: hypothetical protein AUJ98_01250 [Bacteroidetes bacterium CG2_30_33_31]|nr:MAG: hypothetical protein AUJ98_01250 [Bacteroidetes bacterium CG2_30_33_31]
MFNICNNYHVYYNAKNNNFALLNNMNHLVIIYIKSCIMKNLNLLAIFIIAVLASCTNEVEVVDNNVNNNNNNNGNLITDTACNPNTVYFVNDILPILSSSCAYSGCHDNITATHGIKLGSYADVMASGVVSAGSPSNSNLYQAITGGEDMMPPSPKTPLTAFQQTQIRDWISQGAKNNFCDDGCDSSNVTFSGTILPLMNSYCTGCHSGSAPSGGIAITNYTNVSAIAQNGKLYGSITHSAGFSAMPKNGTKLSDCNIAKVRIWIAAGTVNN